MYELERIHNLNKIHKFVPHLFLIPYSKYFDIYSKLVIFYFDSIRFL